MLDQPMTTTSRRILVVPHPQRADAVEAAGRLALRLAEKGLGVHVVNDPSHPIAVPGHPGVASTPATVVPEGCELAIVLGGDGSILWAAEVTRAEPIPLLGINLGHVGFLAEAEREDLDVVADRVVARAYTVEERMTLEVVATHDDEVVARTWALNEVTVEKASRQRMFILGTEIDGRPLATNGCDGIVVATPTGSTAYAFSAGGPVMWPQVQALLIVPVSAHALFARPLVVSPDTAVSVVVQPDEGNAGVLTCDGRRVAPLEPGSRVDVSASAVPVRFARLSDKPFTDRLVAKFDLSVKGWRERRRESFGSRVAPVTDDSVVRPQGDGPAPAGRTPAVGRGSLGRERDV